MSELGQRLIQIVRQKAAEDPGFVYQYPPGRDTCLYVYLGSPSCLIGQALWEAGLIDASLEDLEINIETFHALIQALELPIDSVEASWLASAQTRQDTNLHSWGEAVRGADDTWGSSLVP